MAEVCQSISLASLTRGFEEWHTLANAIQSAAGGMDNLLLSLRLVRVRDLRQDSGACVYTAMPWTLQGDTLRVTSRGDDAPGLAHGALRAARRARVETAAREAMPVYRRVRSTQLHHQHLDAGSKHVLRIFSVDRADLVEISFS